MCGHVGIAGGNLITKHKDAFKQLLMVGAVRGVDGTGVSSVDCSRNKVDWLKAPGDPFTVLDSRHFDTVVTCVKKILMGHNRHATMGANNKENTHPFDFSSLIGSHNGTIHQPARGKIPGHQLFDTDSEALMNAMNIEIRDNNLSGAEAIQKVFGVLEDGAWAIVVYFKKEDKLVFFRNDQRTFYWCFDKEQKVLAWASEAWMLYGVLARNNIELSEEHPKVRVLPPNTILQFSIPKTNEIIPEPERIPFKAAEKKNWTASSQNFTAGRTSTVTRPTATSSISTAPYRNTTKKQLAFPNDNKNGHYKPPYKDCLGSIIKRPEFDSLIKQGKVCVYCTDHTPSWGEEVLFLRPNPFGAPQFLCKNCVHDVQIMDIARAMR